jgi:two-component system, sensor histidine kinase and response regulator
MLPHTKDDATPISVLVVDDDEAALTSMLRALLPLGHRLVTVSSGYEALHQAAQAPFAAIVLDVQMPELDGFETATLLHESGRSRTPPLIFVSETQDDLETIRRGYALGAVDYLTKPVHGEILRAKVDAMASLYQRERQLDRMAGVVAEKAREAAEADAARHRAESASSLKDIYLGILSHDLRTPLTAITMTADLIARAATLDNARGGAERVRRAARRMSTMIEQLVDFTRGELGGGIPIQPTPMDFGAVLRSVVDEISTAHHGAEIQVETSGSLVGAWDGERVHQALTNLLGNAVLHGKGCIRVNASGQRAGVLVKVHNGGPAIPDDQLPRIFEPFRKEERSSGLGLGLYIVREIIRRHGGTIHVRSNMERGTTFTSYWPSAPAPSE